CWGGTQGDLCPQDWVTLEPGPEPERELPSEEALRRELLEGQPPPVVLVAVGPPGGALGGFAVASWGFSTWRGPDLRLGELWVPPPLRGQGIEELLLRKVAQVAVAGGGSQLRVEAPGPWTPPLPPPPGGHRPGPGRGLAPRHFRGGPPWPDWGAPTPPGGHPEGTPISGCFGGTHVSGGGTLMSGGPPQKNKAPPLLGVSLWGPHWGIWGFPPPSCSVPVLPVPPAPPLPPALPVPPLSPCSQYPQCPQYPHYS
ncbi:uncharacterized protein ACIBXB_000925, partial [Morphnus guianensis]